MFQEQESELDISAVLQKMKAIREKLMQRYGLCQILKLFYLLMSVAEQYNFVLVLMPACKLLCLLWHTLLFLCPLPVKAKDAICNLVLISVCL